jgi:hypothetical protein
MARFEEVKSSVPSSISGENRLKGHDFGTVSCFITNIKESGRSIWCPESSAKVRSYVPVLQITMSEGNLPLLHPQWMEVYISNHIGDVKGASADLCLGDEKHAWQICLKSRFG